jgi:myo-inositol-1(or 4)-monophosphatase
MKQEETKGEDMTESTVSTAELASLVEIAEKAAIEAGKYLLEKIGRAVVKSKKSSRDELLDVDIEAERILLERFHAETPHIGILSEEAGFEGRDDQYWIIDPLDGSANFQHGNSLFAIAIALVVHEQTQAGLIYLPTSNEMFTALKEQGAYLNRKRIAVSEVTTLQQALLHFGDFTKADDSQVSQEGLKDFSRLVTEVQRVRMIGTAALDLASVACGRAEALVHSSTHPWDIEAGKLLVQEAGGQITVLQGNRSKPLIIYSNTLLHQMIKDVLLVSGT